MIPCYKLVVDQNTHKQKPNHLDQLMKSLYGLEFELYEQKKLSEKIIKFFELLAQIDERERIIRDK